MNGSDLPFHCSVSHTLSQFPMLDQQMPVSNMAKVVVSPRNFHMSSEVVKKNYRLSMEIKENS